jgi:hypothetical protein
LLEARKNVKRPCVEGRSTDLPGASFSLNMGNTSVFENRRL